MDGEWTGNWHRCIALLLLLLGASFGISGVWALRDNRTIFPEPKPGSQLIERGIYSHVRHPLYTSVMMLSFAWGIWRQSLPTLIAAVILVGFLCAKSKSEEARLRSRFTQYESYSLRTKRFLPWLI